MLRSAEKISSTGKNDPQGSRCDCLFCRTGAWAVSEDRRRSRRAIAAYYGKPLVPVHHAIGHIELGAMLTGACDPLVLLVSGGHTMILAFSENRWRIFGETLDITIGQLLDQLGRAMGFASPCGAKIESLADQSSKKYLRLPYAVKGNDVSFSGILTSAIRLASNKNNTKQDVCYSVQETAFAMMMEALERAISFTHKKEIMIVGGVAAKQKAFRNGAGCMWKTSLKLLCLSSSICRG